MGDIEAGIPISYSCLIVSVALSIRRAAAFLLSCDQTCGLHLGRSTTGSDVFGMLVVVVAVCADVL